ncbi:hypothetical protein GCM10027187_39010 [Streptosporangium sandarakinum]
MTMMARVGVGRVGVGAQHEVQQHGGTEHGQIQGAEDSSAPHAPPYRYDHVQQRTLRYVMNRYAE